MSESRPSVNPWTGQWENLGPTGPAFDPALILPRMAANRPGWVGAGVDVGWQNMVGAGGSALEAVGRATGLRGVEDYGRSVADSRAQRAQEVGRADLATAPWREGGAPVLPWLGYNVAQQIPNLATMLAASAVGGVAGGVTAARGFGLPAAARALGTTPGNVAMGASMLPQAAGSMYREAVESAQATTGQQDARPDTSAALAALGLAPVYAAAEAIPTARLMGIAAGRGAGAAGAGRIGRAARGAAEGAATEFVTEGVQSAMEQGFRPDLPFAQRVNNVIDGAITGALVGGVLGGGAGLVSRNATRPLRDQPANDVQDADLAASVDQALNPRPMGPVDAMAAAQPDLFGAPEAQTPAEGGPRLDAPPEAPVPNRAQPTAALQEFPLPDVPAGEPTLFGSQALASVNPVRQALRDAGDTARDNEALRKFAQRFQATDEVSLALEVQDALNDPRAPKRLMTLAEGLGFFDEAGQTVDFAARLTAARQAAQEALASGNAKKAAAAAAELDRVQRQKRIQDAVAQVNAERDAAKAQAAQDAADRAARRPLTAAEAEAATQPRLQNGIAALPIVGSLANPTAPQQRAAAISDTLVDGGLPLPPQGATPVLPGLEPAAQPALPMTMPQQTPRAQRLAELIADPETTAAQKKAAQRDLTRLLAAQGTADVAQLPLTATADPRDIAVLPPSAGQTDLFPSTAPAPVQPRLQNGLAALPIVGSMTNQPPAARVSAGADTSPEGGALPVPPPGATPMLPGLDAPTAAPASPITPPLPLGSNMPWRDRIAAVMSTEGMLPQTTAAARRWLIEYDVTGMDRGMQQRAERIIAAAARRAGGTVPARTQVTQPSQPSQAPAAVNPSSPSAAPAMVPVPEPANPQSDAREARRRQIAERNAQAAQQPQAADAAAVDATGYPQSDAAQKITLTAQERTQLDRVATSPLSGAELRRAAIDAMNAPTRGKVDSVVGAYRDALTAVKGVVAQNAKSRAASPEARLQAVAKDRDANPMLRNRAELALEALSNRKAGARVQADQVLADYERQKAARALEKSAAGKTETLARIEQPTRRGVLAAAISGAIGTKARSQTAGTMPHLLNGDLAAALDVIAAQSPNPRLRDLARRLAPLMGEVEVRVVEVGKTYPAGYIHRNLHSAYGLVSHDPATGRTTMHLRVDPTDERTTQTSDETLVHEAIHAAIMSRLGALSRYGAFITKDDARDFYTLDPAIQRRPGDEHVLQLLRLWRTLANTVRSTRELRDLAQQNAWLREAASSPDEFITYALTSPEFQDWMKAQHLNREGYWTRFVRAVGGFLGFGATRPTYLEAILDASNALFDSLGQVRQGPTQDLSRRAAATTEETYARVAPSLAAAEQALAKAVESSRTRLTRALAGDVGARNMGAASRAAVLYATTLNHIARVFGRLFPVTPEFTQTIDGAKNLLENVSNVNRRRAAISAKFAELFRPTWSAYERLPPAFVDKMHTLMEATAYEIDPRKSWDEHTWLHKKDDADLYRQRVSEANARYNEMRKAGHHTVFDDTAAFNLMQRYASMATLVHNIIVTDSALRERLPAEFRGDPMAGFLSENVLQRNTVATALDFWEKQLTARLNAADALWRQAAEDALNIANQDPAKRVALDPKAKPGSRKDMPAGVNLLGKTLYDMRVDAKNLTRHPYFHLGRTGEYFASFHITALNGVPDRAAAERVQKALADAGFDAVTIPVDAPQPKVFMRVETPQQLENLVGAIRKLQASGDVQPDTLMSGARDEASFAAAADAKFLQEAIHRFEASPAFSAPEDATDAEKAEAERMRVTAVSQLREAWLNMLPTTSEARVMTRRKVVSGWNRNMMESYAFRANVGNLALANLATSAPMQATLGAMRSQLKQAEVDTSGVSTLDKVRMQQVLKEVLQRETNRPMNTGRDFVDTFRAVNYAYFLGMSPSYVLNNITQVGVTLWPELAKQHGFVKSAKAVAKATGVAIRIMWHAMQHGMRTSMSQAAEPDVTQAVLRDAKVPPGMHEYLLRLMNTGVVDIGAAARELGRLAETNTSGRWDAALKYAGAFGLYSEAAVRLASGIALHDLAQGKLKAGQTLDTPGLVSDAVRLIDDTMFNYTESNVGRALGRQGVMGRYTPIATAFQQFNAQMLEKLYREFHDAMASKQPGESDADAAKRRAEARTFLKYHAAAMVVLAGSLGLPGATMVAAAINRLKDLFDDDDEPYDVQASYRNFLASVMGKDLAEVMARGAPRALGFDMSTRVGEQDIIPLSRFFADRRRWEDAFPDAVARAAGAPWSMVGNVAMGVREMMNGRILAGMQQALPTFPRGIVGAYRLGTEGYVNDQGVRMPMEPGAGAVLAQALGYTPGARAEYSEARFAQESRRGVIVREAASIRSNLARALETGDREGAREWLQEARKFDQNNPAYAVLPNLAGALRQRANVAARAQALDTPLGVSLRDIAARERTAYANF